MVDDPPAVPAPKTTSAIASRFVHQGAFCKQDAVGQTGYTSSATKMVCVVEDGEDQPRWRAAGEPVVAEPTTVEATTKVMPSKTAEQREDSVAPLNP